jgi:hypothetical protein
VHGKRFDVGHKKNPKRVSRGKDKSGDEPEKDQFTEVERWKKAGEN